MLVAVTHAGHTSQSSKSKVSALRFVPTIMLSIYIHALLSWYCPLYVYAMPSFP